MDQRAQQICISAHRRMPVHHLHIFIISRFTYL
jgi:hypothetical protein